MTATAHRAIRAGHELEDAHPEEVLRWAIEEYGDRFAIASSMADAVLVHMAAKVRAGVHVLFLDTGYHFAETIGTRDAVAATYDFTLHSVQPELTVAEQDATHGARLYERDPDLCCAMRKVTPLARALEPYDAWASGIRRDEASTRFATRVVDWDDKRGKVKVNPLATWTADRLDDYVAAEGILVNPLVHDGFPSIGCRPCTRRVAPGEDPRAGRWAGLGKVECGLHT